MDIRSNGPEVVIPEPFIRLDNLAFGCEDDSLSFMQPPYSVYGGKRFLAPRLAEVLPPHNRYVEPMAGAAAVFFAKHPAREEILSDLDPEKVFALRFLKLHSERDRRRLLSYRWTPSKRLFHRLKEAKGMSNPVDRFYRFLYLRWNSFGSHGESFALAAGGTRKWRPYIEKKLPAFQQRMKTAKIYHMDYQEAIRRFDAPDAVFYFDPPYVATMNRGSHFGAVSPQKMAEAMRTMKAKWILSNADSPDVLKANEGRTIRYIDVATRVNQPSERKPGGQGPRNRRELVIANFELPDTLGRKTVEPGISQAKKTGEPASIAAAEQTADVLEMSDVGPTICEYMQASIHEAFTHCADRLAKLGFVSVDARIELSSSIGDALRTFRDACEKHPGLRRRIPRQKMKDFYLMGERAGSASDLASAATHFAEAKKIMADSTAKIIEAEMAKRVEEMKRVAISEFEEKRRADRGATDVAEAVGNAMANAISKLKISPVTNVSVPERRTVVQAPVTIEPGAVVIHEAEQPAIKMPEFLKVEKMEVTAKIEPRVSVMKVTDRDSKGRIEEATIRTGGQ